MVMTCGTVAGSGSAMLSRTSSVSGSTATTFELPCFMPGSLHWMMAIVP